jgi:uncharacterized cupredoxin-like copper-binding protein
MRPLWSPVLAALAAVTALSACGVGDIGGGPQVAVTLDEYHVNLSESSGSSGKVTFKVHNNGHEKHEFVILKTSLDAANLPEESSKVKEDAEGIEHVSEIDGVDAAQDKNLTVDLKPGTYVFVCNIPGHAHQGMVARFTVQ